MINSAIDKLRTDISEALLNTFNKLKRLKSLEFLNDSYVDTEANNT